MASKRNDDIMYRAAANRCLVDAMSGRNDDQNDDIELAGFLATFHPEMSADEIRDLVRQNRREKDQEARERRDRR